MTKRGQRFRAAAVITAAALVALGGVGVSLALAALDHGSKFSPGFNAAVVLSFTAVGAVIAAARPANRVGWFMLLGGALWGAGGAAVDLAHHGIVTNPGSIPAVSAFAVAGSAVRSLGWYSITLGVPSYFPEERLIGRSGRRLKFLLAVIFIASVIDPLTDHQADLTNLGHWRNPVAPSGAGQLISAVAFLGHIPLSLVATVLILRLLVTRWRDGDALRRQQLELFVAAAALPVLAVPIVFGVGLNTGAWIFGLAALPLPFAIGFAVLARGLYDLRTAVNRGLVWLTLSALVAGLYALIIAGLGARFNAGKAAWLGWVAAAAVAVSFSPLRDALQRGVNRVTFGRWEEPYEVIAGLGQRLEASADIGGLLGEVVEELHTLGLSDVAILDARGALLAGERPKTDADVEDLALSAYGSPVGQLQFRPPPAPLRSRDRRLLEDLAGHLGGVLHAYQLTGDLQNALERTVFAREEERRRLRRELHDGLGPSLAGHLLRLDVIAAKVTPSAVSNGVGAEIDSLRDDLRATVGEVRRVVEGLRPAALDELGLTGALSQVVTRLSAGTTLTMHLEISDLPPLSAAVEVAAFRIVTEAVANAVRHSKATTCRVIIESDEGRLRLTVADNGTGFDPDPSNRGNGLHTMRERAEELRGRLRVDRAPGTSVVAELPIGVP